MNDFLQRRRSTLDPPRFQGWGRRRSYFEGWYFKLVVPVRNLAYALIPGISYDRDGNGHAFLQVLDGVSARSQYHRYPTGDFQPARDRFALRLGPHYFDTFGLRVELPDLQIEVDFLSPTPWPRTAAAPGVMGWYGFVPRMQCYHGLVSLHHGLAGHLTVNGRRHAAEGGTGYTEKDWGSGFPTAYVWGQSNHLSGTDRPASLMVSYARIPWLGSSFTGFLATFLFGGRLHLFTTWNGAGAQGKRLTDDRVALRFEHRGSILEVSGPPSSGGTLASPVDNAGMTGKVNEDMTAELDVQFTPATPGEPAYTGTAHWSGWELMNISDLL